MPYLVLIEMLSIFYGSQFLFGFALNMVRLFLKNNEVNYIQKALEKIDHETVMG